MVEKVMQLLNLLTNLNQHPFLKGKWVLTPIFWLPRLGDECERSSASTGKESPSRPGIITTRIRRCWSRG